MPLLGRPNGLLAKPRQLGSTSLNGANPSSLLTGEVAVHGHLLSRGPRASAESSLGSWVVRRNVLGPPV
eukprot:14707991-Alexandrium_andersonii.AAC.1